MSVQKNLGIFIASLMLSLVLWLHVQSQLALIQTRRLEFEVRPINLEQNNLAATMIQKKVSVTARGRPEEVEKLAIELDRLQRSGQSLVATVDLSNASPGTFQYPVRLQTPRKIDVEYSDPGTVPVTIDELVRQRQPVIIEAVGVRQGFYYSGADIRPDQVTLSGPARDIARVGQVRAQLDLSEFTAGRSYPVVVEVLDKNNKPLADVASDPAEVEIRPTLSELPTQKNVLITPQWAGQPAFGFRVRGYSIFPTQVSASGDKEQLATLQTLDTEMINIEGLRGDTELTVDLRVPKGIRVEARRKRVSVQIRIEPIPQVPAPDKPTSGTPPPESSRTGR
ncbi:MAG TPA: CdaR family protein [Fimbriimonadaceae bacterium]|nr:CdaR family protein [Fimbriimonadaceae bacterium]